MGLQGEVFEEEGVADGAVGRQTIGGCGVGRVGVFGEGLLADVTVAVLAAVVLETAAEEG